MKTRVINLTAHEARAFQRGASVIVRECKGIPHDFNRPDLDLAAITNGKEWAISRSRLNPEGQAAWPPDPLPGFKPPYQPGGPLIGREAWQVYDTDGLSTVGICYKASYDPFAVGSAETQGAVKWFDVSPEIAAGALKVIQHMEVMGESWKSAAVMPQWAARVRRIVTAVSLKRCQDLTEGECEAMGYAPAERVCLCGWVGTWEELADNQEGDDEDCHRCPKCDDDTDGWYLDEQYRKSFAKANAKMWSSNKFVWVANVKEEK